MDELMRRRAQMLAAKKEYIIFADPEVERICIANYSSDGIGVTKEDAAKVTSLGTYFKGNTSIVSFDELQYFTNVKVLGSTRNANNSPFTDCTNLVSVDLRNATQLGRRALANCPKLESVGSLENIATMAREAFQTCSKLAINVYMPSLRTVEGNSQFYNSGVVRVTSLGTVTALAGTNNAYQGWFRNCKSLEEILLQDSSLVSIGIYAFSACPNLKTVKLPSTVTTIARYVFASDTGLETLVLLSTTPPSLASDSFNGTNTTFKIYVPYSSDHSILNAYKTASNWSNRASQMYELDEDGNIPT